MLSVIVVGQGDGARLPGILAALTSAAVEGLVREVLLAGGGPAELLAILREETGAELADDLTSAIGAARGDLLLVMGDDFRPKLGWLEALSGHLRGGAREGALPGEGGGFLRRAPTAILIERTKAARLAHPDLDRVRRALSRGAGRIGQV